MTTSTMISRLDRAYPGDRDKPFFDLTLDLLRGVRDYDYNALAAICDDDYGIIDIAPNGGNVAIRNRAEWEAWFRNLFAQLKTIDAATDSEILAYDAVHGTELGYSVLEFRQTLTIADQVATFDCIATIVWKQVHGRWHEARWHGSVLSSNVPDGMLAA